MTTFAEGAESERECEDERLRAATPDATLDGLLAKRDEACYRHEVTEANAAIRAYVEQEKAALRAEYEASDGRIARTVHALRVEVERLRNLVIDFRNALGGGDLDHEDQVWWAERIDAALASPKEGT